MYSSNYSRTQLGLFSLFVSMTALVSSCSLRLNEKPADNSLSVKTSSEGCFNGTSTTFSNYFDGKGDETAVNGFFNCADSSLTTFLKDTTGADPTAYTETEFSRFLSRYILKEKPLTGPLMAEVMALKVALLGGSADRITRAEFSKLKGLLRLVQDVFNEHRSLFPLKKEHIEAMSEGEIAVHRAKISGSLIRLATFIEENGSSYSFGRLESLIHSLLSYNGTDLSGDSAGVKVLRLVPTMGAVRTILMGPGEGGSGIARNEWKTLAKIIADGSDVLLDFINNKDFDLFEGTGSARMTGTVEKLAAILKFGISFHSEQAIAPKHIETLLLALKQGKFLEDLKETTIQKQVEKVFGAFFKFGPEGSPALGITAKHVDALVARTQMWSEGVVISARFGSELREVYFNKESLISAETSKLVGLSNLKNQISEEAALGLVNTVKDIPSVFADHDFIQSGAPSEQKVYVYLPANSTAPISKRHLSRMSFFRAASLLVIQYSAKTIDLDFNQQVPKNLPKTDYEKLLDAVVPILADFKLVDTEFKHSMMKRFVESGLFLAHSNGDEILDLNEALELEALLLSTVTKSDLVQEELLVQKKCRMPFRDKDGEVLANTACVKKAFLAKMQNYWQQVPKVIDSVVKPSGANAPSTAPNVNAVVLNEEEVFKTFDSLTLVSRTGAPATEVHGKGDTRAWILLPYYMDLAVKTHDRNQDDVIDFQEAVKAFPNYDAYLQVVIKKIKDSRKLLIKPKHSMHLFLWLLKYGSTPQAGDVLNGSFKRWISAVDAFQATGTIDPVLELRADRTRILDALVALAKEEAKNK